MMKQKMQEIRFFKMCPNSKFEHIQLDTVGLNEMDSFENDSFG